MQIKTTHTLAMTVFAVGEDQQRAALAIINRGAETMNVEASISSLPLPDGADPLERRSQVLVRSDDMAACEAYWHKADAALEFIGVEVSSP